ncbi:hypothetical protein, partial [Pontibacter ummariensis]|uniref:hypothetical protein n=1 Tax=Pontibacter ummariensis TaxID=1610492 RepID=UPI0015C5EFBD
ALNKHLLHGALKATAKTLAVFNSLPGWQLPNCVELIAEAEGPAPAGPSLALFLKTITDLAHFS